MHKDNLREPFDLHDPALRDRAVRAARGQAPFDILLTGGLLWMWQRASCGQPI